LLTDRDEMSSLYRGPSIDASYQVLVHLAKRFQSRRIFRNQPIRNKNCLWWPCLLTNWDDMSNIYRGPCIDSSYQVSVHLAKRFQKRRFKQINQSKTRIACGGHFCKRIRTKCALYITSRYSHLNILFSSSCQRQCEILPSLVVRCLSSIVR
jgi:hypothetical protein